MAASQLGYNNELLEQRLAQKRISSLEAKQRVELSFKQRQEKERAIESGLNEKRNRVEMMEAHSQSLQKQNQLKQK